MYTFSLVLKNHQYTLQRVIGIFSRRHCQIQSIQFHNQTDQNIGNIRITVKSSRINSEQLEKQLRKLIDVIQVKTVVV